MRRHDRKNAIARKVTELLQTDFSSKAEHNLNTAWNGKDCDRAGALRDCLYYYYRSWGALLDGNVVDNTTMETALRTPGLSNKKRCTASNGNSSPPASTAKKSSSAITPYGSRY
jgi:hypothetical protein